MCKEHIKAIKQILKNNHRGSIPVLKCMEHSQGTLKATDLTVMVQVKTPTIADGIWKPEALDYGFKDDTKETEWSVEDFPEFKPDKTVQVVKLTGEDMAKITRAMDFVSKDLTRPVLTGVVLKGKFVYGCDGFKLYRNGLSTEVKDYIIIPAECIKVLKTIKANKHQTWTLEIYDGFEIGFNCGNFTLYSKLIDGSIPQYDELVKDTTYDFVVPIDMKQIANKKDRCLSINKNEQKLYLTDRDGSNAILLSECVTICNDDLGYSEHIEVIMPLIGIEHSVRIDLAVMKQYKGKVVIRFKNKEGTPIFVEER